jgi:hypothetical protein
MGRALVAYKVLVMFKSGDKPPYQAVRRIGRIAERRHTAIAVYIHAMGSLKALDAGENRFAPIRKCLFKNRGCHNF